VAALVREELEASGIAVSEDVMGNLTVHVAGAENAPRVMLSAHMDEVGFMITEIGEDGFLRFSTVGGISPTVLVGRPVLIGNSNKQIKGTIAAKGIHFQTAEERKKVPTSPDMYVDIGVTSREEAEALVELGAFGTFDTPFSLFGKEGAYLSGKALDDRAGCALLIELLRRVAKGNLPLDLYVCFTVREEIGLSGATVAASRIAPDVSVVLEATAISDLPGVPENRRVADMGAGGVLSLLDKSTIYDRTLVNLALEVGKAQDIPVQVKRFVSGGNDAGNIQRTGTGVRCLALSLPTRYLHAPVTVAAYCDYLSMKKLLLAFLQALAEKENA
jgi:endoglucanase